MMDMQYSLKNISVMAGSWVRINLVNKGADPVMIHNILIVNYNKRLSCNCCIRGGAQIRLYSQE